MWVSFIFLLMYVSSGLCHLDRFSCLIFLSMIWINKDNFFVIPSLQNVQKIYSPPPPLTPGQNQNPLFFEKSVKEAEADRSAMCVRKPDKLTCKEERTLQCSTVIRRSTKISDFDSLEDEAMIMNVVFVNK